MLDEPFWQNLMELFIQWSEKICATFIKVGDFIARTINKPNHQADQPVFILQTSTVPTSLRTKSAKNFSNDKHYNTITSRVFNILRRYYQGSTDPGY